MTTSFLTTPWKVLIIAPRSQFATKKLPSIQKVQETLIAQWQRQAEFITTCWNKPEETFTGLSLGWDHIV